MADLLIIGVVAGGLLGLRFKILILIPASLVTIAAATVAEIAGGYEFKFAALTALGTVALLQIGYLLGCIVQVMIPARPSARAMTLLRRDR
jgi:hypothetical protein